jgi:hypothetical protein
MVRVGAILPFTKYSVIITVAVLLTAAIVLERYLVHAADTATSRSSSAQVLQEPPATPIINSPDTNQSTAGTVPDDSQNSNNSSSSTSVTVNGQSIPVPQNGSYSQTINNDGSTTTVNVDNQNISTSDSTGNSNHSSLHINVHSSSSGIQEGQ